MINVLIRSFRWLLSKKETGVLLSGVALCVLFASLSNSFLSMESWAGIMTMSTELGIVAIGVTLLMIAGEFDLSVGANFAFTGMLFAWITVTLEWHPFAALFVALLAATIIGLINGLLTIKTRIPSFITTLGTMLIWRGIVLFITNGFPISNISDTALLPLVDFDLGNFHGTLLLWIGLVGVFFVIARWTAFGNWIFATGGNADAAFTRGVATNRVKMSCFIICGLLAGLAGVIQFTHLDTLSPTAGEQYELRAIAATVIGGTALTGGIGTIVGTALGTILTGVISSGLVQIGVSAYWFRSILGLILILAVFLNLQLHRSLGGRV